MTVGELIKELQEYMDDGHENTEVRIASQPNYPFEWEVSGSALIIVDEEEGDGLDMDANAVVYIAEGEQIDIMPEAIKEDLGTMFSHWQ